MLLFAGGQKSTAVIVFEVTVSVPKVALIQGISQCSARLQTFITRKPKDLP
jgi:hypothetical protein